MNQPQVYLCSLPLEPPPPPTFLSHSSVLAWRIPWTEEPVWWAIVSWGHKELDMTEQLTHNLNKAIILFPLGCGADIGQYALSMLGSPLIHPTPPLFRNFSSLQNGSSPFKFLCPETLEFFLFLAHFAYPDSLRG